MSASVRTVHVRIAGRVQGVGYRAWTEATAQALGLTGWVRNRSDGTVEAMFEGSAPKVAEMLERCRSGPAAAEVTAIETTDRPGEGFPDFRCLPTA
jgi:acylphosphatase